MDKKHIIYAHSQSHKSPSVVYSSGYCYLSNGIVPIFSIPLKRLTNRSYATGANDAPAPQLEIKGAEHLILTSSVMT